MAVIGFRQSPSDRAGAIALLLICASAIPLANAHGQAQYGGIIRTEPTAEDQYRKEFNEIVNDEYETEELRSQEHLYGVPEAKQNSGTNGLADTAISGLFGTGAPDEPRPQNPDQWGNMDDIDSGHYRDSAELRLREELGKPLPERKPFGDELSDIERQVGVPPKKK